MPVLNVVGNMPECVKSAKTKNELIHKFNQIYSLSVSASFSDLEIKNFESNLSKDVDMFKIDLEKNETEISWMLLQILFMRRAMKIIPDNDYVVQILELLLSTYKNYDVEKLREKTLGVYSVYMLKNGQGGLNPRHSQIDTPLPHVPSVLYAAMFHKRKQIINYLYRTLTIDKMDTDALGYFFASIKLKNKKEYIEAAYDVIFNTMMNTMTENCDDIYDYENNDDEQITAIVMEVKQTMNMALNSFIHDVELINECSSKITEIIVNKIFMLISNED